MSNFADEVAAGLAEIREELGEAITIVFTDGTRIPIEKATRTSPVARSSSSDGTSRRMQSHDWLIGAAELTHDGQRFLPEKDMGIEVVIDDGARVERFQMQPFGKDRSADVYENSDAAGTQFRVHSIYLETKDVNP